MKLIITLLFLSLGAFSYGQNEATCNIDNYKDYIYTPGDHQCDLEGAFLFRMNLSYANLQGADLQRVNLYRANLQWANLSGAYLYRANLQRANLQGADLQRVNLYRADLQGANLQGADLQGANLRSANFTNAKVDPDLGAYLTSQGVSGFVVVEDEEGH